MRQSFTPCAPHTHVTPAAKFRGTSKAGLFGDHIQELDSHVGTLLKTLDELKIAEKTLVIFTSDNGGLEHRGKNGTGPTDNHPLRAGKGSAYEGGVRVPLIVRFSKSSIAWF